MLLQRSMKARIRETLDTKETLLKQCPDTSVLPAAALWNGQEKEFTVKAALVGVLATALAFCHTPQGRTADTKLLRQLLFLFLRL